MGAGTAFTRSAFRFAGTDRALQAFVLSCFPDRRTRASDCRTFGDLRPLVKRLQGMTTMKTTLTGILWLCAAPAVAQTAAVAEAMHQAQATPQTKIPPGYLAGKAPVDILKVLPPPPAPGSAQDIADRTIYAATARDVGDANWKRAVTELNPTGPSYFAALSCAAGARISPQTTPATYALIARVGVDMAAPMTVAKNFYKRGRPFTTDKGKACDPMSADGIGERLGYSYPSGHSGIGWLWALVLSDAAPGRAEALRTFGQATGDLRVACRVHWLSDVAYGRVLATTVYDRVAAEPEYQADVARARAELAKAPPPACPAS
jgi:acid phosphatase (class A)